MSTEVAEQLPIQVSGLVVGTAFKTHSKNKRKRLAKTFTSQQSTKNTNETVQNLDPEFEHEISILTETGKNDESECKYYQPSLTVLSSKKQAKERFAVYFRDR